MAKRRSWPFPAASSALRASNPLLDDVLKRNTAVQGEGPADQRGRAATAPRSRVTAKVKRSSTARVSRKGTGSRK